jgi:hypothetical protein
MTKYGNVVNLFVIAIAIGLVYAARENYESFGNVHSYGSNGKGNNLVANAATVGSSGYGVPLGAMNMPPTVAWYNNYNPNYPMNNNPYAYVPGVNYQTPGGPNSNLNQTPLMYPTQLYPRIPFAPQVGRPCSENSCGATGVCQQGICQRKNSDGTVFNIPV